MTKVIAIFNNKGGVSKTTTCFNLGWILAERGHKVVMVDADPQCNLTGMTIDLAPEGALDEFYKNRPNQNIKDALEPAFASRPVALEAVDCVQVEGVDNLWLVPGHVGLAENEVALGIAQQLSESIQPLRNLPGSFRYLIDKTAEKYEADYVLIDLSPSLGAINQNLVTTADYFMVPISPDVFSMMAMESLARVLPKWADWGNRAEQLEALKDADYPFPKATPKFLGAIIQRYRLRDSAPTRAFQDYFDILDEKLSDTLAPALDNAGLLLDADKYANAGFDAHLRLASIPDFNALIANSQTSRKPVYALTQLDVQRVGKVWETTQKNIESFRKLFEDLAERIEVMTS